jgi:hypothetical protein
MHTYPKIDTVFHRNADNTLTDMYRSDVVRSIRIWRASEKIDGTNVRIGFRRDPVTDVVSAEIGGRTDNAQLHVGLSAHLHALVDENLSTVRGIMEVHNLVTYTLYGEGYGAKIQSGGSYRSDQGFILFDVLAGTKWLPFDAVQVNGSALGIPVVPDLGEMPFDVAVSLVREGFESRCAETPRPAEGLVLRTLEPLTDNRGRRVIAKLKTKDFR